MSVEALVRLLLHALTVVFLPPLLLGVINKTKAAFGGRVGPPLLQPYFDLLRLFRKGTVTSATTSWVFRAGPVVSMATALAASLLLPLGGGSAPLSFAGDFVLFAYLLGLGRFFTVLAALDTGSAFEGMGASREATFSALAEPALFLGLVVLVRTSGSTALSGMLAVGALGTWGQAGASLTLVVASLIVVLLAENSRIPFDDPNTHLELTMIHEVMVLDHSGPMFGMILYGASLKLLVLGSLIVNLVLPLDRARLFVSWPAFAAGMVGLAVVVGVVESTMARLRMLQIPSLLVGAFLLSGFGVVLLAR
jgi:formate hydrogenlyase subunit 4